jgi:hypothetical protein
MYWFQCAKECVEKKCAKCSYQYGCLEECRLCEKEFCNDCIKDCTCHKKPFCKNCIRKCACCKIGNQCYYGLNKCEKCKNYCCSFCSMSCMGCRRVLCKSKKCIYKSVYISTITYYIYCSEFCLKKDKPPKKKSKNIFTKFYSVF